MGADVLLKDFRHQPVDRPSYRSDLVQYLGTALLDIECALQGFHLAATATHPAQ